MICLLIRVAMKIVLIETLETNTARRGFYPPSAVFGKKILLNNKIKRDWV
jgi:hypothetical protein